MNKQYNPKEIEPKWQDNWEKTGIYKTPEITDAKNKMYVLPQLPYPSGSGLHAGHAEVYTACDMYARFQRMKGKHVLQVVGWDSFGLPAENYAIKNNVHPQISTDDAIDNFRSQIKALGISVDWDREVGSHNADYYKWTQWFFLLMYKQGLAYRKMQAVNWCDSCKTVLANAQVEEGKCERCDTTVIQKEMEQWYIRITDYAEKLLESIDGLDWPEETKKRQKDWIGKSVGAEIHFGLKDNEEKITVFTTRPDTIFGATYMVLAPEHKLVQSLQDSITNWSEVKSYVDATSKKTDLDRQVDQEKTGVELQGVKAVNPVNGEEISVWIADYVLASYGTGAIMAVPAHDERDFEFAKKFDLNIREVVSGGDITSEAYTDDGEVVNSDFLNGLNKKDAIANIIEHLEKEKIGKGKTQYKLRDWSVSRQRFWGAPIPMVQDQNKKQNFLFIHGYTAQSDSVFWPWLKAEIESQGSNVHCPDLPDTDNPNADAQVEALLSDFTPDENTVIVAHSHGSIVTLKLLEKINTKVAKVIFVDGFIRPEFSDKKRSPVEASCDFSFDFEKIKTLAHDFVVIADDTFSTIPEVQVNEMVELFDARQVVVTPTEKHFCSDMEPVVLEELSMSHIRPLTTQDLPVILPNDVDFKPTGQSPLTYSESFQDGVEEKYGAGWKREVDTLDTFMCSSWYFFRYLDPKNDNAFASPEALKNWMPVDFYLGGPEHVNGHLLYARFFTKVLHDAGYIDFDEPFKVHRHQGLILAEDGRKMSKRWGNVINPTDAINEYGADTVRMYEMFMGPLEDAKKWSVNGIKGVRRFLDRVWNLQERVQDSVEDSAMDALVHKTIKKVGDDIPKLGFNTSIAKLMELSNAMYKVDAVSKQNLETFLKLLSPFAPHMAEELWSTLGNEDSVTTQSWPTYDESKLVEDVITLVVQVNGKVRAKLEVASDISEDDAKAAAMEHENVITWLDSKEPKKVIYIKGKLISIVV